jgi:hypothetical protein
MGVGKVHRQRRGELAHTTGSMRRSPCLGSAVFVSVCHESAPSLDLSVRVSVAEDAGGA